MSEVELKPCPFCGGKAYSKSEDVGWDSRGENVYAAIVCCSNCGANFELEHLGDDLLRNDDIEGDTCHALEEQAAALWNMRAIDRDKLLRIAEELEVEPDRDVYYDGIMFTEEVLKFERELAARIRKAVSE